MLVCSGRFLAATQGANIAIIDDDCLVGANWLVAIWAEFQADPTLCFIGGRTELYDPKDLPITIVVSRKSGHFLIQDLRRETIGWIAIVFG